MLFNEILDLYQIPLAELSAMADKVRRENVGDVFETCTICNAKCGQCSEDCRYCAQSAHHNTDIEEFDLVSVNAMVAGSRKAAEIGSGRYGIITSGKGLDDSDLDMVAEAISSIAQEGRITPCASLGILAREQLQRLKDAGLHRYHHNIETASSYFPKVTTTHTFEDRLRTIELAREVGLSICSGGIIGMGERREDRARMALELSQIKPDSIPFNVLMPIPGTPMEGCQRLTVCEVLKTIAVFRIANPAAVLRLAAGRETFLKDFMGSAFLAGANAMMIGGYLTQRGRSTDDDAAFAREVLAAWSG